MAALYDILGISPSASSEEVRSAFKRRALSVHPDKGGSKEEFQAVMAAFEILADASRRCQYDQKLTVTAHQNSSQPERASRARSAQRRSASNPAQPHNSPKRQRGKSASSHKGDDDVKSDSKDPKASSGPRSESKDAPQSDQSKPDNWAPAEHHLLRRLSALLRELPADKRREVLAEWLSQPQRLELERWMRANLFKNHTEKHEQSEEQHERQDPEASEEASDGDISLSSSSENELSHGLCQLEVVQSLAICDYDDHTDGLSESGQACRLWAHEADEVLLEPVADENMEQHQDTERTNGCLNLSGISVLRSNCGRQQRYRSYIDIKRIRLRSRTFLDLDRTLDVHVAFLRVKEKIRSASTPVETAVQEAVYTVFPDYGLDPEKDFDLLLSIPAYQWIGTTLPALFFHARQLGEAMTAWSRLMKARGHFSLGGFSIANYGDHDIMERWTHLKEVYLEIATKARHDAATLSAKLSQLEAMRQPTLERYRERFNCVAMARAERQQRQAEVAEVGRQLRELRAMRRAERDSWRAARMQLRQLQRHRSAMHRIEGLVATWSTRLRAQAARQKILEEREARVLARQERLRREERWKQLMRKDVTMEELLGKRHLQPDS